MATILGGLFHLNLGTYHVVVALTGSGPVCATDKNFVRFFSYSGIQTLIITTEDVPISMAGSKSYLFIIFSGMLHATKAHC